MSSKLAMQCWDLDLDKTAMLILMCLCDSGSDWGTHIYPEVPYIAWKTRASPATIYRVLADLERDGIIVDVGLHGKAVEYEVHLDRAPMKQPYERKKDGRPRVMGRPRKRDFSHGEKSPSHGEKSPSHGEKSPSHGEKSKRSYESPSDQVASGPVEASMTGYPVINSDILTQNNEPDTEPLFVQEPSAEPESPAAWARQVEWVNGVPVMSKRLRAAGVLRNGRQVLIRATLEEGYMPSFDDWAGMHAWPNGVMSSRVEREREYKRFVTVCLAHTLQLAEDPPVARQLAAIAAE